MEKLGSKEIVQTMLAIIADALDKNPEQDFLGGLYMRLNLGNHWTDLRLGFDLTKDEIPDIPENIFYHPPYWNMNGKIVYSNTEYDWREVKESYGYDPRESDLSQRLLYPACA